MVISNPYDDIPNIMNKEQERSNQWLIDQYNRNRPIEDKIDKIEDIPNRDEDNEQ